MRGREPDGHCFGQVSAGPIGRTTLVRNLVLLAIAVFVTAPGSGNTGPSAVAWLAPLGTGDRALAIGVIALLALVVVLGWVLLKLFAQHGRLLLRVEALEAKLPGAGAGGAAAAPAAGLPVGSKAPGFSLPGVHGEMLTLDALRASGRPLLLLFSDPGCGPCLALAPEVGRWQKEHAARMVLAVISRGGPAENRAKFGEHGVTHVLLQKDREVNEAYRVAGTPSAVLVGPDGTVAGGAAAGADAIRQLVAHVAATPPLGNGAAAPVPAPPSVNLGDPAPAVAMPDLDGKAITLRDYRGKRTVLLFWNPGCGSCQQMGADLKSWEDSRGAGAPELLLDSAGDVGANRAMALKSTIVLDQEFATGRALGVRGTPSAVLVDAKGRVASEVAVGGPAVLTLLGASSDSSVHSPKIGQRSPTA